MELIYKGAEAEIYKAELLGLPIIIKRRIKKSYRNPSLDIRLRRGRTRKEARLMRRALLGGVPVPAMLDVWNDSLMVEYIEGSKLANSLGSSLMTEFGRIACKLHSSGIAHNDLTPYNALVTPDDKICLIDFGLAAYTHKIEDYAVDLYVLKRSLISLTDEWETLWKSFLRGYKSCQELFGKVIKRLVVVEARGRYK